MSLKQRLTDDVKSAMRAGDKQRLTTLRMTTAAIKQREVDERIELQDEDILAIIEKMIKQRRDAEAQFRDAERTDLADQEAAEIDILQDYMPRQLDQAELEQAVDAVISKHNASGMQDMGPVMGELKQQLQGQADMARVSDLVKQRLTS